MTLSEEFGLEFQSFQKDPATACKNLSAAIKALRDDTKPIPERIQLSSNISTFATMCRPDLKMNAFMEACPEARDTLIHIITQPDDDDKHDDYSSEGIQTIAENLSSAMNNVELNPMQTKWALHWCPFAFQVLDHPGVAAAKAEDRSAWARAFALARCDTIINLFRSQPNIATAYSTGWTIGDVEDPIGVAAKYQKDDTPSTIRTEADGTVRNVQQFDKGKIKAGSHKIAGPIIKRVLAGDAMAVYQLKADMYDDEPEPFNENVTALIAGSFSGVGHIYNTIAGKKPEIIVPALPVLMNMLEGKMPIPQGQGSMVMFLIKHVATAKPELVFPHVDIISQKGIKLEYCEGITPMAVGACGRAPGAADKVIGILANDMRSSNDQYIAIYFNEINNLLPVSSGPRVLDDHMEFIRTKQGAAAAMVEKLEDYYQGRSLANAYDRLDELEEMVLEMNEKVSSTCANFEEVKAYVDQNMAEMKEFVATIAKKLPQPVKLTVVTGVRKTLRLHFACVRTGHEWTCESKDWNKWMKVGFSVMKLGKCVLDIGMGNPLGLVKTGVDALSGIYKAFKDKDDEEFDKYISEPFLTSAESDKLINQLRDGGFFEKFAYDAQAGGWVALEAVSQEERDELTNKRDKKINELKQNKETVKGKNLGFGSAKDIARGAGAMAKAAGLGDAVGGALAEEASRAVEMAGVGGANAELIGNAVSDHLMDAAGDEDMESGVKYGGGGGSTERKTAPGAKAGAGGSALDRAIARRAAGGADSKTGTSSGGAKTTGLGGGATGQLRERMTELEAKMARQEKAMQAQAEQLQTLAGEVQKLKSQPAGGGCCIVQ